VQSNCYYNNLQVIRQLKHQMLFTCFKRWFA
jgi:hypothetical protein